MSWYNILFYPFEFTGFWYADFISALLFSIMAGDFLSRILLIPIINRILKIELTEKEKKVWDNPLEN